MTTTRCPKCGKNNYGDVKKCSFCGAPLVFIPGEETPQINEEDVQEKLSQLKIERIRNPLLIGGGGITAVVGIFLAVILFLVFMIFVFNPADVRPYTETGALHYGVPGGEEYIFGKITMVVKDSSDAQEQSYGYKAHYYAYEIDGDGKDNRIRAHEDNNVDLEPDLWIYSKDSLGNVGDRILVKVKGEPNDFGEVRAVSEGKAAWGGSGWFSGGWIFLLPGILMFLTGVALFTKGIIGKADRSLERLMEEDQEFRRQQLMLREAARKQMESQARQQQWSTYGPGAAQAGPVPVIQSQNESGQLYTSSGQLETTDQAPQYQPPSEVQPPVTAQYPASETPLPSQTYQEPTNVNAPPDNV